MKTTFMKKHVLVLFLLSIGVNFCVKAQVFVADLPPGYNKVNLPEKEKGMDGSPWLTESWVPGTVVTKAGETITGLEYRYNVYRNNLYFKYNNAEYRISSPDSIQQLIMDGKTFIYDNPDPTGKAYKRFMEVAIDGNASLYINYYAEITPANFNLVLNAGNPNETVSVKEAYLIKVGSMLTVIDKKGKKIPVALADKKKEISEFIKKEKISAKKREDIEKVVKYYNSL
jgi:hypothetical protein